MTEEVTAPEGEVRVAEVEGGHANGEPAPAQGEHEGHEDAIVLPQPTIGPLIVGFGATVLATGLLVPLLLPVGAIITLAGVWVMTSRSRAQLEADHHLEEETRRILPGVELPKLGMWVFLASEVMFFAALISTFVLFKTRPAFSAVATEHGVIDPMAILNLPLVTLNTFLLLASSFAVASGLAALNQDRQKPFRRLLIVTLVLGAIFLAIQGFEWYELLHEGVTPDTLFGTAFFTTTGFHGLHVFLGLVALVYLLVRAYRGAYSSRNPMGIELFGLYWHFVDVVWIVLFTVIYLI
ncbi:MAG: hypothetical protein Kow00120_06920 [Anaerolineae bacterium]